MSSPTAEPLPGPAGPGLVPAGFGMTGPEITPDYCRCETLVLGCGNELFGDDGFGPAVARHLGGMPELPDSLLAIDAGTGVRQVLFDLLLSPVKPSRIVIVDAVDMGRQPGEVWVLDVDELPAIKTDDFSMHQLPTSNLLRELRETTEVEVICVVAQVGSIPPAVRPGLSPAVERAAVAAARTIARRASGAETWETKNRS